MTDKKSQWSTDGKIGIVFQTFDLQTSMVETCREDGLDLCPALLDLPFRVDNRSQYTNREFRSSMAAPGIYPECIYVSMPEQNGRIRASLHKTLKKGYVWPREFADIQEVEEVMLVVFEDYNTPM